MPLLDSVVRPGEQSDPTTSPGTGQARPSGSPRGRRAARVPAANSGCMFGLYHRGWCARNSRIPSEPTEAVEVSSRIRTSPSAHADVPGDRIWGTTVSMHSRCVVASISCSTGSLRCVRVRCNRDRCGNSFGSDWSREQGCGRDRIVGTLTLLRRDGRVDRIGDTVHSLVCCTGDRSRCS
jgi:hypothetical protein